jgi:hypothetical protein
VIVFLAKNKLLLVAEGMSNWHLWKRDYFLAHPICEVCGLRPSKDLDHAILGRDKRFRKWLNVEWNYQACCAVCNRHDKKADWYEERMEALERKLNMYGYEYIRNKLDGIPDKKKLGMDWRDADVYLKNMEERK